ncbi:MAG: alanine--tRNA ligase-related protein [Agathobacter sp.]|nr:alanine--tRNA ligase-related protein [Agathobacter sp.]
MSEIKTVCLYDRDAYATDFEATVISCQEITKEDRRLYAVVLDQTLFFPEEGGQSPDKGVINDIQVTDVQINNDIITHYLESAISAGSKVKGSIDWTHRFNNMQQHSGEHVFSGIVHNKYGYDNVGFHLSDQVVTMDFNGVLSADQVAEIEWEVNQAIAQNVEILVTYPSKEELASMEYRSKIDIDGQVRIVTVTGYDVCACCAPHVRRTGEIGGLKVMNLQNYKGGVRISILCGLRALAAFCEKCSIVSDLTAFLTTGQENLVTTVKKLKASNQALSSELSASKQQLLNHKLSDIPKEQADVIIFESGIDTKIVRNVVNGLVEKHSGICGLFVGSDSEGYNYVIGSSSQDCKILANTLREKLGAKGGGSPQMIQGSVKAAATDIQALFG